MLDDPGVVNTQPYNNGETLCWGDVNGDGNLDAFLPVYPASLGGPGNFFLRNQGPGPGGEYRFRERSAQRSFIGDSTKRRRPSKEATRTRCAAQRLARCRPSRSPRLRCEGRSGQ